ncbi:hypothetical protein H1P_80053 [Hyella patelloides LEGE 07179]|uniref:Uncharacterized protein n=1 Tax=Hyella patelloides LEGE 07179 TaxID=945734 RepID=A0A563W483_9CYAN|nr:hypothetical protein [Hyella patelloides]VEP18498.1 hypothetical protein H1P_80053 [Hyella patelloides LEGE 07179]
MKRQMSIEQKIERELQKINSDPKKPHKIRHLTPEEKKDFIDSLITDDEDWTEEDEIKYQRVMKRLQR